MRLLGPSTEYHINNPLEQPSLLERSSASSSSNDSVIEIQPTKPYVVLKFFQKCSSKKFFCLEMIN
jgi:hypothetical protein